MTRHVNMRAALPCALVTIALGSLSGVAAAVEPNEFPTRTVNFADLDLSHSAGVAVLYARIKAAAGEVCDRGSIRDLGTAMRSQRCKEQAIDRAVAAVNAPGLTSYYRAKTRQPITVAQRH